MSIRQATRECQDPFFFFVGGGVWGLECCSLDRQGRGNWEVCTLEKGPSIAGPFSTHSVSGGGDRG